MQDSLEIISLVVTIAIPSNANAWSISSYLIITEHRVLSLPVGS